MSKASDYAALLAQMTYKDGEGDVLAAAWFDDDTHCVYVRLTGVEKLSAEEILRLCRWGLETLEEKGATS